MKPVTKDSRRKVRSIQDISKIAIRLRRSGKRIVTSNGCFDILHVGHVRALAYARSLGDVLILGINSDASVRKNKGKGRPIIPARERAEMLAGLESVDYVFIFGEKTPVPWIGKIRPHVHVKSSDYTLDRIFEKEAVEKHGGKIKLFPHTGKHSTSSLIKKIQSTKGS